MIGRISQKDVFGRLQREGTYARVDGLWVSCLEDPTLPGPHVGYAIGRSAGNAVRRNRVRRQLRHLMAARTASLRPAWYLVGLSAGGADAPLDTRLDAALERAHQRLTLPQPSRKVKP